MAAGLGVLICEVCEVTLRLAPASSEEPWLRGWRRLEHPGPRPSPCLTEGGMRPGGHSDQEGGSSPGLPSRDLGPFTQTQEARGRPLLSPPGLALSPGATMGKGGQSPVERASVCFGSNPGPSRLEAHPGNTSTRAHCAPRPHRAHNSLTRRGGRLLACCSLAFSPGCSSGGCPRRPGSRARQAEGGPCEASTGPAEAPTAASRGAAARFRCSPPANSPVPGRSLHANQPTKARATL